MKTSWRSLSLALILMAASACSDDAAAGGDAGSPADGKASADGPVDGWQRITDVMKAEIKLGKIKGGFALLDIYSASDGKLLYSKAFGGKARTDPLAVASASKWVTSTVILALVADGTMSLTDTTKKWLKWTGVKGLITLKQLLTFTSGLRDPLCLYNPLTTLDKCVKDIESKGIKSAPGQVFYYGGAHMHVAARMAEVATGKTWHQLFTDKIGAPLKLDAGVRFYASPKKKQGALNPLASGGLVISTADYGKFLTGLIVPGAGQLLSDKWLKAQHAEQWPPSTKVEYTPPGAGKAHYALGCWRQCLTPDKPALCNADLVVNSSGAFGFTPWWDKKNGYYAVLGAEAEKTTDKASVYNTALAYSTLRPLIIKALSGK